jgi:hypothetical protein
MNAIAIDHCKHDNPNPSGSVKKYGLIPCARYGNGGPLPKPLDTYKHKGG